MFNPERNKSNGIQNFSEQIKEKSILQRIPEKRTIIPKPILTCEPEEVILQNIEKNKMYEVPVRIYNSSNSSKRITIKMPKTNVFKVDYDRKTKNTQIAPGLYLEILVIFETDNVENYEDWVEITSENDFKINIKLNAFKPRPIVHFEPFVNFGFVPTNTKKTEIIEFINEGMVDTTIELKLDKNTELQLKDKFELLKNTKENKNKNRMQISITYEPKEASNLNEKIEVFQLNDTDSLGFIEVIATSVVQQVSVVFEEGGGPTTEIRFGKLYYGQTKECSAFLVNNGPKEIFYKFFFHPDKNLREIVDLNDSEFVCTPQKAGEEMTQRILSAEPLSGTIKPYTQIPIKFMCKSKFPEFEKGFRSHILEKNYENEKEINMKRKQEITKTEVSRSTAAIKFEEAAKKGVSKKDNKDKNEEINQDKISQSVSIYMEVTAILPHITLDKTMLNFWECKLHERKYIEIRITNKNEELPVDYVFTKIPHFTVEPKSGVISTGSSVIIKVTFHPENYGHFQDVLVLYYVKRLYNIAISVFGSCKDLGKKQKAIRGTEATDINFIARDEMVSDDLALNYTKRRNDLINADNTKKRKMYDDRISEMKKNKANDEIINNFEEKYKVYESISKHKKIENQKLNQMRYARTKKENEKAKVMEHLVIGDKYDAPNKKSLLDLLMSDKDNLPEPPKFQLPEPKDKLWVVRAIGPYEPENYDEIIEEKKYNFDPDIRAVDKVGIDKPKSHTEIRDCEMEIDGNALQKILVGPKDFIDFGEIFKNSEQIKTFWIKNKLKTCIFIKIENDIPELKRSKYTSKVIYPGQTDGFNLVFFSNQENSKYSQFVKYLINYKYSFKLPIRAKVVPVTLSYNTLSKFVFKNEKLNEQKYEMSVTQKLKFQNNGNADAKFTWDEPRNSKLWIINPMKGIVAPKKSVEIEVIFAPIDGIYKSDQTEELKCNLDNGNPIFLSISGNVSEARCSLVNDILDFGNVHVGQEETREFTIKNDYKNKTAYCIKNTSDSILQFKEATGYIDITKKTVTAIIKSMHKKENYEEKVEILIRGGNKLILSVKANIMEPNVYIEEEKFDFGQITFGGESTRKLTFHNTSPLTARVIVNLNNNPNLKDFKIQLHSSYKGVKDNIITNLDKENNEEEDVSNNSLADEENDEEESEEEIKEIRNFEVEIAANSKLEFEIIFKPDNSHTSDKEYKFDTEFELKGVKLIPAGLKRPIIATLVKSKIFLNKEKVVFQKTFIYGGSHEKNYTNEEVKISNDTNKLIKWFIDTTLIDSQGIFEIKDKAGDLLPNRDNPLCSIRMKFQPDRKGIYTSSVVLNILDDDTNKFIPYKTITLTGEGTHPRIYFDRRQIIMPIVPLNIESKVVFKINHEGFENTKLSSRIISEMGAIPLIVEFLDGKTIGILKSELRIELTFKSPKPLSFTCKLSIFDEDNRQFDILVCGSSENCLFTNNSFLHRNKDNFDIVEDEATNSLNLKFKDTNTMTEMQDDDKGKGNDSVSHMSSVITKGSTLASAPRVGKQLILNCKYIKRYILLVCSSSSIKKFPEDIMKDNGEAIYEIIYNLSGKHAPGGKNNKLEENIKDKDKLGSQLRKNYDELIRYLQEQGCFLNTIFPEFLLDFTHYNRYIAVEDLANSNRLLAADWQEKRNNLMRYWKYYNKESWVLLIYQILKVFYLPRVNFKSFKNAIRHLPETEQLKYNSFRLPSSNIYSTSELIIIKWMQALYDFVNLNPVNPLKITNFTDDLSEGSVLASIVMSYFPEVEDQHKAPKKKTMQDGKFGLQIDKFLQTLKDYGVYTHVKNKHFSLPTAREMLLFIIMLFQNLQHFIPKDTIVFTCVLGETVSKTINLSNPKPDRRIEYFIKKKGSEDFIIQTATEIKLETGEVEFPIQFKSRISAPVEGKIYFINKNEGLNFQAAPLVFNLKSNVTGRKSIPPEIHVTSPMYKEKKFKITVKSMFKERGEFEIKLIINKREPPSTKKVTRLTKQANKTQKVKEEETLFRVFYTQHDYEGGDSRYTERLEYEKPRDITLHFLPIDLSTYECYVVLINEKIGEFQYTIVGTGELPEPIKALDYKCQVDEPYEFNLELDQENKLLVQALSSLKTEIKNDNLAKSSKVTKKNTNVLLPIPEKVTFNVETTKTIFIVPANLTISSDATAKDTKDNLTVSSKDKNAIDTKTKDFNNSFANKDANSSNVKLDGKSLTIKFNSKICQFIEGDIILRNIDKLNDIRIYRIKMTVGPKNIRATLEFTCPVYEKITQKIPIHNNSDKDWIIRAELTQDSHNYFSGLPDKKINKRTTDFYLLTFYPKEKSSEVQGKLVLNNTNTQELYEYKLVGKIDDPLAEGSIQFECETKETQEKKIEIVNKTDREIAYIVETDMPDVVSGVQSFSVKPNSTYQYKISVKPLLGKVYFGKITFYDERKNHIWYTIKIEAKSKFEKQIIEMKTSIRKAIYVEVLLENPSSDSVIFYIDYEGEALYGAKEFRVEGGKSANYLLFYAPLKVGSWTGRLHIYNEYIGEFLYQLKMTSEENPPIYPDTLKAELGKSVELSIILDNPLEEEVEIYYRNTNVINYSISPEKIFIANYGHQQVNIKYTPSSLDNEEESVIIFENPKVGRWEYHLRGRGTPPTIMETTSVSTYVGGITSGMINFKNPFKDTLNVAIELKCAEWQGTFRIMLKKRDKYSIEPFRVLQIPFSFGPQKLTKYFGELYVYIAHSRSIFWVFPIEGVTEVKSKEIDFTFKTKSKKLLDQDIILDLTNMPDEDVGKESFTVNLRMKEEKYKSLVEKCLNAELQKTTISQGNNKLPMRIKFYPLRPFKTECEFIVSKNTGGNWIFNVILESTEPEPDDTINIQSSLGKVSHVSFKLHNVFTKNAKFVAYFSHDSSSEFTVSPREGFLDQSGREGTTFLVSYLPVEYGKIKIGKLIIETDEIQWIFEVRGTHLDYKPPDIKSTNIHKMTKATMMRMNDLEKNDVARKKVKEIRNLSKSKSKSRSRSRSKSPKQKK